MTRGGRGLRTAIIPCIIGMWHGQFMLLPLIKPPYIAVDVMLARHGDAEALGRDAQALRHAADPRRRRRLARQGSRRQPRLPRGRAGAARGPHGGHDGRRAGRARRGAPASASSWWRANRAGRSCRSRSPPRATSRFNTWSRMTINLPYSGLGFAVGPHRQRAARRADRGARELSAGGRGLAQRGDRSWPTSAPAPTRPAPRRTRPLARQHGAGPVAQGLSHAHQPGASRWCRCCCGLRERRGKEEPARRGERLGQPSVAAARGPARLVPRRQRRRDQRHAAADGGAGGGASVARRSCSRPAPSPRPSSRPSGWARAPCISTCRSTRPSTCAASSTTGGPTSPCFTESEIWPNLILESAARGIPLALVNARMTKRSFRRWRRNPGVARPLFSRFELVLAQNETLARRFATLGAPAAPSPTGNLKVDAPPPPVDSAELERLRPTLERPLAADRRQHA